MSHPLADHRPAACSSQDGVAPCTDYLALPVTATHRTIFLGDQLPPTPTVPEPRRVNATSAAPPHAYVKRALTWNPRPTF